MEGSGECEKEEGRHRNAHGKLERTVWLSSILRTLPKFTQRMYCGSPWQIFDVHNQCNLHIVFSNMKHARLEPVEYTNPWTIRAITGYWQGSLNGTTTVYVQRLFATSYRAVTVGESHCLYAFPWSIWLATAGSWTSEHLFWMGTCIWSYNSRN